MSLSAERVLDLARVTGFREATLEKVLRLAEVLADVSRHPFLSTALVLKGGTALNLFFGEPRRLSVDLDFNYVAKVDRAGMLEARPEIERAVNLIGQARGYQVQRSPDTHAGRKLFLSYTSTTGNRDRIEIDLNFLHRVPLTQPVMGTMWQPGDIERPSARIAGIEDLVAGKLCALLVRAMPRDLFDATRLPGLAAPIWGTQRCKRLFVALAGTLDHPLTTYDQTRLDRVTDERVAIELWPTLTRSDSPTAAELKERTWLVVAPLLDLDDAEREYTERIQGGDLRPEVLFPDDLEMADRLRQNPALLWKVENARRHVRNGGSQRRT